MDKPDTTFFFVSPDGTFVKAYSGLSAPKEIAEDMTQHIIKYSRNNPTWHGAMPCLLVHACELTPALQHMLSQLVCTAAFRAQ